MLSDLVLKQENVNAQENYLKQVICPIIAG